MKRTVIASIVLAAATVLGFAAHAQGNHDHGAMNSAPGTSADHDMSDMGCCKPDPNAKKEVYEKLLNQDEQPKAQKKPGTKKSGGKAAVEASPAAK